MDIKTIVITGSTRGIGYHLALDFLRKGHQVVINGRSEHRLTKQTEALRKINSAVTGVSGDVADVYTHQRLVQAAMDKFGRIDIWINNAGIPQSYAPFTDLPADEIDKLIQTNITGVLLGTQIAAQFFLKQGHGKIFNMEGFGSNGKTMPKMTLYGTSKRAVNYFTASFAKEVKNTEVQVSVLSPGMVRTEFLNHSQSEKNQIEKKRFEKVYRYLAEDVQVVAPWLSTRILKSRKNYDRIEFLSGGRLAIRLFKLMIH
jgi:short-subunit dehydrogenase